MDDTQPLITHDDDRQSPLNKRFGKLIFCSDKDDAGLTKELHVGKNRIGRDPDQCDIALRDKATVSRVHAVIEVNEEGFFVLFDNNSMNGTKRNGQRLKPRVLYALDGEEILEFGDIKAVFSLSTRGPSPSPAPTSSHAVIPETPYGKREAFFPTMSSSPVLGSAVVDVDSDDERSFIPPTQPSLSRAAGSKYGEATMALLQMATQKVVCDATVSSQDEEELFTDDDYNQLTQTTLPVQDRTSLMQEEDHHSSSVLDHSSRTKCTRSNLQKVVEESDDEEAQQNSDLFNFSSEGDTSADRVRRDDVVFSVATQVISQEPEKNSRLASGPSSPELKPNDSSRQITSSERVRQEDDRESVQSEDLLAGVEFIQCSDSSQGQIGNESDEEEYVEPYFGATQLDREEFSSHGKKELETESDQDTRNAGEDERSDTPNSIQLLASTQELAGLHSPEDLSKPQTSPSETVDKKCGSHLAAPCLSPSQGTRHYADPKLHDDKSKRSRSSYPSAAKPKLTRSASRGARQSVRADENRIAARAPEDPLEPATARLRVNKVSEMSDEAVVPFSEKTKAPKCRVKHVRQSHTDILNGVLANSQIQAPSEKATTEAELPLNARSSEAVTCAPNAEIDTISTSNLDRTTAPTRRSRRPQRKSEQPTFRSRRCTRSKGAAGSATKEEPAADRASSKRSRPTSKKEKEEKSTYPELDPSSVMEAPTLASSRATKVSSRLKAKGSGSSSNLAVAPTAVDGGSDGPQPTIQPVLRRRSIKSAPSNDLGPSCKRPRRPGRKGDDGVPAVESGALPDDCEGSHSSGGSRDRSRSSTRLTQQKKQYIMFTGIDKKQLKKMVIDLGGQLTDNMLQCTILIADQVRRTDKFLCAIALGLPIVSTHWLQHSKQAKTFLDPWQHLLQDAKAERKFSFCLSQTLRKASSSPLLAGYQVYVTKNCSNPPRDTLKEIIQCAGGSWLARAPDAPASVDHLVVVACPEDVRECEELSRQEVRVMTTEFILTGLLRQSLDFQAHRFHPA